ncbi:unnamed protein product [Psylliodes chrysocephalus]|uniref:Uncharacterized protein n=1 Tax=Psylliodes chrysocephalus TaxID=3402493 RepID=A0A9P0D4V9_9CUCU|nr:unnamed protein product [Psylliodes chrysocephala]
MKLILIKTTANREEQVIVNNTNRARHNRGKKRAIKGDTRAVRQHRKEKRNTGQEYVNFKEKKKAARIMQPLKPCRNKCRENISEEERHKLFTEYWAVGDYNRKTAYVAGLLEIKKKAVSRPRTSVPNKSKHRMNTVLYHLQVNGRNVSLQPSMNLKDL